MIRGCIGGVIREQDVLLLHVLVGRVEVVAVLLVVVQAVLRLRGVNIFAGGDCLVRLKVVLLQKDAVTRVVTGR